MEQTQRVATWLELAAMPTRGRGKSRVRLHPVDRRRGSCFVISIDGRWLCAGNGELTVFKGLGAALRFLEVLHIDAFEPGEAAAGELCGGAHCCLTADQHDGLSPCRICPSEGRHAMEHRH